MKRRTVLKAALAVPAMAAGSAFAAASSPGGAGLMQRCRPADADWPAPRDWQALSDAVGGRLIRLSSPFDVCRGASSGDACDALFKRLKNPYFVGDTPSLTQTSGWIDAWTSAPSVYAVAAASPQDVVEAVNFARERRLRLVVKGGGHSYQGTSNAPDSLLVWTRNMHAVELHDAFVAQGCAQQQSPQPAVTVGAGAVWMHVYDAVTTQGGRYVQGGGCATVGVAGLVQGGGFGSFSKRYGLAAGSLLEAQIVTADGKLRTANACTNPDLFWALKGGGGGTFGVVTSLTLRTHALPRYFGGVWTSIKASTDADFQRLIARFIALYADSLFNEHWGETVQLRPDRSLHISMLFQGLTQDEAAQAWKPFFDWIADAKASYVMQPPQIIAIPAAHLWDPAFMKEHAPGVMLSDDRPGAAPTDVYWASNVNEASWFLYGYESMWLPSATLHASSKARLVDALVQASRHWSVGLHFNKGLAGAPAESLDAARNTAMNPAVIDAFALVIIAGEGPPAVPGLPGHEPDFTQARTAAQRIRSAADTLRANAPHDGAYVSESSYFQSDWQHAYWGANYSRLLDVKRRYDAEGLFIVHNGVGSEQWTPDGFTRLTT